jgi:hypothetical protein
VSHRGPVVVDRADTTSVDREYFEKNPDSTEYEGKPVAAGIDERAFSYACEV